MVAATAVKGSVEISVVFPAYNEAALLESTVAEVSQALNEFTRSYEIIIAEDGSTDGTDKLAAALAEKHTFVKHIHGEKRLGRGAALNNAFNTISAVTDIISSEISTVSFSPSIKSTFPVKIYSSFTKETSTSASLIIDQLP